MINETELIISNKSYTNKDFASIYPELLELAKKLTNKWDPSTSNESDPGVVLLKLLAFIGDKTNYNIDKNILEAFLPSATQESSVRRITEMNGYEMGYYNSATTDITFMYRGLMTNGDGSMQIVLNAFDTVVTGTDENVTYVLLDRVELTTRGVSVTKPAIEGTLKTLRGTDGSLVQVTNLNDNNRLYFPERFVATNGIFIVNTDEANNLWDRVDNLSTEVPGTKCFKFGFDSTRNLPFIEFPKDIASLIGNGLDIKYVLTKGSDGNIKANLLSKLYNTTSLNSSTQWTSLSAQTSLPVVLTDLIMTNNSASGNGRNPETINEAYNNFKRVVGTFNTLVTTRDYANFIYRLLDNSNNFEVSNVQVADRRTDINYGNNVVTFNNFGQHIVSNEDSTEITPYELCIYPLNSTNDNYDLSSYKNSFKRKVVDVDYFDDKLQNVKTISHDTKLLDNTDTFLYKNYYKLNVRITTTRKVSNAEANAIIENVKSALYRNFNAREIDYGYEIPFDTIFNVIQNSDSRIKNISLDEPELSTKVMKTDINTAEINYTDFNSTSQTSEHQKLLAKNIVAGRVSLFDYYTDFSFEFYQSKISGVGPVIERLDNITTKVTISETDLESTNGYKLRKNEVIQLIGPNLTTKVTYPAFINFNYTGANVPAGAEYELKSGEVLKINYTDTDDVEQNITYPAGTIIKTSFLLQNTATNTSRATIIKLFNGVNTDMNSLTTKETIEIRDYVQSTLSTIWKVYWILDEKTSPTNTLFPTGSSEILLGENDSFLYSDDATTELVYLGPGTKLKLATASTDSAFWTLDRSKLINVEKIQDNGLAAFSSFDWKSVDFSSNNLTIQEMSIYTFGEGARVKISDISNLTNTSVLIPQTATIEYKNSDADANFTTVPQYNISSVQWSAKSRLDINMSPEIYQEIESNQEIVLEYVNSLNVLQAPITITKDGLNKTVMNLNAPLQRAGGVNIDLKVTTFTETGPVTNWLISSLVYNISLFPTTLTRNADTKLIVYEIKNYTAPISLPLIKIDSKDTLIFFYWNKTSLDVTSITITATGGGSVSKYNQTGSDGVLVSGLNIIKLSGVISSLTITIVGPTLSITPETLIIGTISVINDLNHDRFKFDATNKVALTTSLLSRISQLATADGKDIFFYTASLDPSHLIEIEDLSSPIALFDYNNIANQFTLAEIDVENSFIDVVRSSRL